MSRLFELISPRSARGLLLSVGESDAGLFPVMGSRRPVNVRMSTPASPESRGSTRPRGHRPWRWPTVPRPGSAQRATKLDHNQVGRAERRPLSRAAVSRKTSTICPGADDMSWYGVQGDALRARSLRGRRRQGKQTRTLARRTDGWSKLGYGSFCAGADGCPRFREGRCGVGAAVDADRSAKLVVVRRAGRLDRKAEEGREHT